MRDARRNGIVIFALSVSGVLMHAEVCGRPTPGSVVTQPPELSSSNGRLNAQFSFRGVITTDRIVRYCYMYNDSVQSPTLRVHPGDELVINLTNNLRSDGVSTHQHSTNADTMCAGGQMSGGTTNLHFHGLSIPPACHQDEVLRTLIPPAGQSFEYRVKIPKDQPPGLYWYHPHPHGHSEEQVLGGASGALIVEGLEHANPEIAGLPERILILRDSRVPWFGEADEDQGPGKDISLNYIPIVFPLYRPVEMPVRPGEREFWRVLNASADTYFDLQIRYGAIIQEINDPQPIEVIALDGAATGRGNGSRMVGSSKCIHVLIPPGGRAEFIATMPPLGTFAQLVTLKYDTGLGGDVTPYRVLANIRSSAEAPAASSTIPSAAGSAQVFQGLEKLKPVRRRKLYFSEERPDLEDPKQQAQYFITVEGQTPRVFQMDFQKPDIVATQGTVEDWMIENRAREAHTFHIHQLHFQVLERDGQPVGEAALRDTIDLPYWDGKSSTYPSVKLRMDFRSKEIVGTFVFHCHILEHEDGGMMGSIEVVRPGRY
jgi:FtsP/CotA-like multicopper oxidase with cupredoxin domain